MKIEKEELAILAALERDASAQRKEIAFEVGISEASLSKKITSLKAEKYIKKFTVELDYAQIGFPVSAITLLKLNEQSERDQLLVELKLFPHATEISTLFGDWDILVRWTCKKADEIDSSLESLLSKFRIKVVTLPLAGLVKHESRLAVSSGSRLP